MTKAFARQNRRTNMHANLPHYLSGGEVHVGDRVRYKGTSANVVFVTDGDEGEFAPGYEDYYGHEAGLMICDDDGDMTFLPEPTEDLEFVHREGAIPDLS
jgi:hypothetical protein